MPAVSSGIQRPLFGRLGGPTADKVQGQMGEQGLLNQQQLQGAQHGLQQAGIGASTARATADQKLQTAAPWLQKGLSQQAYEGEHGMERGSQLQAAAEARRMAMFQPYLDKFGGGISASSSSGGGGATPQHIDFGGLSGAEGAAQSAAFARAKDQAGLIGRSAMDSLSNVMGARGLTGSGLAANAAGGVINQQANQLGEVNRDQAITGANLARQRASEMYQGNITQRGQDIVSQDSQRNAMLGLLQGFQGNITARY